MTKYFKLCEYYYKVFPFKFTFKISLILFISTLFFLIRNDQANAVNSNGKWKQVGSLSGERAAQGIALLENGNVIVSGGYNGSIMSSSEIYDPTTQTWSPAGELNIQRMILIPPGIVTLSDGKALIVNGEGPGLIQGLSANEIYNPDDNTWALVASSIVGRYRAIVAPLQGNKVLLAGGNTGSGITNTAEIYNPSTNSWTPTGNMHRGREVHENFTILNDGRIMVAGGTSNFNQTENTAEIYDPNTGQWTLTTMPFAQNYGTITTLQNGKILAVGSYNGSVALDSTAIFDPSTNTWNSAKPLSNPRAGHKAELLADGNVIVFGGDNIGSFYTSTEIYNPNTNTWAAGPTMIEPFTSGATIKLSNGDILAVGGFDGTIRLSSTYIFTNDLSVPALKQNNPAWGSMEYDTASLWNPANPSISAWGCALTSVAMVFKYHGYDKLPGGSDLDPGTLNDWLKNTPGGYIRNGLVNWLALSRLSKLAKDVNGLSFNALEYKRVNGYDPEQLTEDLDDGYPGILGVPGHFVVAKGVEGDTFNINDPLFDRFTLEDYDNTFNSLGRYIPSSTDLSYIMLVVDENVDISLSDSNNVATGSSSIQEPLDNDLGDGVSGEPLNIFYLPKPENDSYNLTLSSNSDQNYQLDVYFYDEDGNLTKAEIEGLIGPINQREFTINFSKDEESTFEEVITINTLIGNINSLYALGEIKNKGIYNSLVSKLNSYEKAKDNKTKSNILNALMNELEAQKGKGISNDAYDIILDNIDLLTEN